MPDDETNDYPALRSKALAALDAGDRAAALAAFRPALEYPGRLGDGDWADALSVFARIAAAFAGDEWAQHALAAAGAPDDVGALYQLGYQMIEQSLHDMAATVLARAHRLAPAEEGVLTEFVAALERAGRHGEACRVLRAAPGVLAASPVSRYLLGYNALMTGDLIEPRAVLRDMGEPDDERVAYMVGQLRAMVRRADAVRGVTPLDDADLRGWHFVVTGGLLLHLSPYGFDEGMRGRYAYFQDSPALCLEGLRRLEAVLAAWGTRPDRVFLLDDRDSTILGLAAARVLGLPAEPWPATSGNDRPGLVVAYDLRKATDPAVQSLYDHRPGQLLWSHASSWTDESPFAADLTTYLYQYNVSPWEGGGLRRDPETQQTVRTPPAEGPAEELARAVAEATLEPGALADLPQLVALAQAARAAPGDAAAGAFLSSGHRRRQRTDSPVKSNRFV